jgi:hypothetical protein
MHAFAASGGDPMAVRTVGHRVERVIGIQFSLQLRRIYVPDAKLPVAAWRDDMRPLGTDSDTGPRHNRFRARRTEATLDGVPKEEAALFSS